MIGGFNVQESSTSTCNVHFIHVVDGELETPELIFSVRRETAEATLSLEEAQTEVDRLLNSFPEYVIDATRDVEKELRKVALLIASQTRRGVPSIENLYKGNVLFYFGKANMDQPIAVAKFQDKYAVVAHPALHQYGYVIRGL